MTQQNGFPPLKPLQGGFPPWNPLRPEGEEGYRVSWYAAALSEEVVAGKILPINFLGGSALVVRDEKGVPQVFGAKCPHQGGDLSAGKLLQHAGGCAIRCPFHHFLFDTAGDTLGTCIAGPKLERADRKRLNLASYPTRERFGIVWAFHGGEPLFELPDFPIGLSGHLRREEELEPRAIRYTHQFLNDPAVFQLNAADFRHFLTVHGVSMTPTEVTKLPPWGFRLSVESYRDGGKTWSRDVFENIGTGFFYRWGMFDYGDACGGRSDRHLVLGLGLPEPGRTDLYLCYMVRKGPDAERQLANIMPRSDQFNWDDKVVIDRVAPGYGYLCEDEGLLKWYYDLLNAWPRAAPIGLGKPLDPAT